MKTVLDLACGSCSPIIRTKRQFRSIGVDIYEPSIKESRKRKIHDQYIIGDILDLDKLFPEEKFDAIVALDVLEHLPKQKAKIWLKILEKHVRSKIIITTPNGFIEQHPSDENKYQKHLSGWSVSELQSHGYTVFGMRGLKSIRGEWSTIYLKPWIFWACISTLSQFFLYYIPEQSMQLFAVKIID
jgi:2-polyprenyl-3-methyl-5-hydroxy-6-metoxy-1,4-benzoquinol methylase